MVVYFADSSNRMAAKKVRIVGLKWRQFERKPLENQENDENQGSPSKEQNDTKKPPTLDAENGVNAPQKLTRLGRRLSHAVSVTGLGMRETFGSFRQVSSFEVSLVGKVGLLS